MIIDVGFAARVAICTFVLSIFQPSDLIAQGKDAAANVQRFLNALAERRDSVKSARFELSGKVIQTAVSIENRQAPGQYYPSRDERGDLRQLTVLDFEGNRFRQDYQGAEMFIDDSGKGALAPIRRIHTFDGMDLFTLHPRGNQNEYLYRDAPPTHYQGIKWDVEKSGKKMPSSVFFIADYPMLFSCGRIPDPTKNFRIDARPEYTATDFQYRGVASVSGIRCVAFRWVRPPVTNSYAEWYVDAENPARIVRFHRVANGQSIHDLEIHYKPNSQIPAYWTTSFFDNDNPRRFNKLAKDVRYTVDSAELNQGLNDGEFSPDFTPGMLISTKDGVIPVSSDGKSLGRPQGRWALWKIVLGGLALLSFMLVVIRSRRIRANRAIGNRIPEATE